MDDEVADLRTIADYQFGAGAGDALFLGSDRLEIRRSASGRPRQVHLADGGRLVSVGRDGQFTLGLTGGRRLADALDSPAARVEIGDESEPYVRDGRNVFARFVSDVDPAVRAGDEVVVVHNDGAVVAVGRAELDADAISAFDTGMAVKVRDAASEN
jgi:uncharacterized protein with predicted RNA binding PUA domain